MSVFDNLGPGEEKALLRREAFGARDGFWTAHGFAALRQARLQRVVGQPEAAQVGGVFAARERAVELHAVHLFRSEGSKKNTHM